MRAALTIARTMDMDLVNSILRSDGIWENIGGKSVDNFDAPVDNKIHYLHVEWNGETAGLFILHPDTYGVKIHANMLPAFRGKIALQAASDALNYGFMLDDTVYAEIPEAYPNVIEFAARFLEPAWVKDGVHTLMLRAV